MGRGNNYIRFEICTCGANNRGLYNATDGKLYYACNKCGKTSIHYRAETERDARRGWNKYIQELRKNG